MWICSTGNFPTEEAFTFSEWKKGLCSRWLKSPDPCNLHFMAHVRAHVRWLMVTFLSPCIRNRSHAQHAKLWNANFLYLKSYSDLALTKVPSAKLPFHQTKGKCIRLRTHWSSPTFYFLALIQTSPQLKNKTKRSLY